MNNLGGTSGESGFESMIGKHLREQGDRLELPRTLNKRQIQGVLGLMGELNDDVVKAHGDVDAFSVETARSRFAAGQVPTAEEFEQAVLGAQNLGAYQALSDVVQRFGEAINPQPPTPEA